MFQLIEHCHITLQRLTQKDNSIKGLSPIIFVIPVIGIYLRWVYSFCSKSTTRVAHSITPTVSQMSRCLRKGRHRATCSLLVTVLVARSITAQPLPHLSRKLRKCSLRASCSRSDSFLLSLNMGRLATRDSDAPSRAGAHLNPAPQKLRRTGQHRITTRVMRRCPFRHTPVLPPGQKVRFARLTTLFDLPATLRAVT